MTLLPRPSAVLLGSKSSTRCSLFYMNKELEQWLGVHVPRTINTSADRLSHPLEVDAVVQAAEAAGMTAHLIRRFSPRCWVALREAIDNCPRG